MKDRPTLTRDAACGDRVQIGVGLLPFESGNCAEAISLRIPNRFA